MELVYLWVEDYKNIEKQGFNFSPRFECKYENGVLDIKDKEETGEPYLKNFFGENINVTAIVGENGSGKSSILKSIVSKQRIFIVVFNKELTVYTKNVSIDTSWQQKHLKSSFFQDVLYYSMDDTNLRAATPNVHHIVLEKTNRLITENYLKLNSLNFNLFDFKPAYIYYELNDFNLIGEDFDLDDTYVSDIKSALGWDINSDSGIILDTIKALRDIEDEYMNYLLYQFGDRNSLFENINLTEKLHPKDNYLMLEKDEIQETLKTCELPFLSESEFKSLIDNKGQKINIVDLENLFGKNYLELLFVIMKNDIDIDYWSLNDAKFNSLSHGQKTIYSFIVNLVNYNNNEFLFFLDEPDNTLHPNWQKKFLNELIEIIKKLNKRAHIIITTHSPFLLSDLPKENVIFLEKYTKKEIDDKHLDQKVDNCKNATKTININPFGANIHTLLSNGFFMKDGLMGEFAKDKINTIIKNLADKNYQFGLEEKKQLLLTIKSIGEEFLKSKLLDIYYKKFDDELTKKQRKEELLREQKKIQQELERL